jgi:hypothetical protein
LPEALAYMSIAGVLPLVGLYAAASALTWRARTSGSSSRGTSVPVRGVLSRAEESGNLPVYPTVQAAVDATAVAWPEASSASLQRRYSVVGNASVQATDLPAL